MESQQKHMLMQSFLRDAHQQAQAQTHHSQSATHSYASSVASSSQNNAIVLASDGGPEIPASIDQFREYVRKWMELDNTVKKAQHLIREKRKQRDALSIAISKFMCKYDIEDLNTKEGRIRCKVTQVKAPLNQKVVKEKIASIFQGDEEKSNQIIKKLYEERDTVQKVSLRRLKIE